jgi:preprotein translocase subunit YajC
VLFALLEVLLWLQPAATGTGEAGGGGGGGAGAAPPGCAASPANLALIVAALVMVYFVSIRPQNKRQREQEAMLKALRKGTIVRTTGGIRGEILDLSDAEVTLLVADKTKINVLRSHIAGLVGTSADAQEAKKD